MVDNRIRTAVAALAILGLIAWVYWPVQAAGLIWDDKIQLRDATLQYGNDWLQFVFRGFADWKNYFRPLGVALFAADARIFQVAPAPIHLLSLGLHLVNTLLVGALARSLLAPSNWDARTRILAGAAMLLFGLHPLLVEPVAWIASQFELLVTLFMLLGLLANVTLQRNVVRAAAVALCFFLAACAKEAAISFPLLLLIVDWMRSTPAATDSASARPWRTGLDRLRQQRTVYLFVLAAGILYLALRYKALGVLVHNYGHAAPFSWSRFQLVCFTFVTYWKLLVWPMSGLGPIHITPMQQFAEFSSASSATDATALAIAFAGFYLFWRRKPLGGLIMGVTAALFPVLHIVPIDFEESVYHDRYAMTAVAVACSFLPLVIVGLISHRNDLRRPVGLSVLAGAAWLLLAVINIRVTLPLWSDEVRLWEWSLRQNPGSIVAQDHLLSAYLEIHDLARAQIVADALMKDARSCANCMINVAYLAVSRGDAERATIALQEAKRAMDVLVPVRRLILGYILTSGNLSQLQHDPAEAEEAYNAAISLDPLSPDAHMSLAFLQARRGRTGEARKTAETALSLCAPDERAKRREEFERVLSAAIAREQPATVSQP